MNLLSNQAVKLSHGCAYHLSQRGWRWRRSPLKLKLTLLLGNATAFNHPKPDMRILTVPFRTSGMPSDSAWPLPATSVSS